MGLASDLFNAGLSAVRAKGEEAQRYKAEAERMSDAELIRRIRNCGSQHWKQLAYLKVAEERGMTREEVFG